MRCARLRRFTGLQTLDAAVKRFIACHTGMFLFIIIVGSVGFIGCLSSMEFFQITFYLYIAEDFFARFYDYHGHKE